MPIAIVTGSGGLMGSESVRHFAALQRDHPASRLTFGVEDVLREQWAAVRA